MSFSKISQPELISLHIPKTAGTSFRNILKNIYGEDQVVRFDINEKGVVKLNEELYDKKVLPPAKVIHGHFSFETLNAKFTLPENYKLITWIRDPVQRVISNFFYLESRLAEILISESEFNILYNMPRSLIEYARVEFNRNKQMKFLSGRALADFDFVGIYEYFTEELTRLGDNLDWKRIPESLYQNKTVISKRNVSENILHEIAELNKEDIELYNYALEIRTSKLSSK